ncbi:MAG: hypothetical protein ACREJC_08615, partial [Tepidisphaeraceae bacterium]
MLVARIQRKLLRATPLAALAPWAHAGPIPEPIVPGGITISLREIASGLVAPSNVAASPDGSGRRFISELAGRVWVVDASGNRLATPFLDIASSCVWGNGRGMTGITFAPDFNIPSSPGYGKFYTLPAEPMGTASANFGTVGNHQAVLYE